MTAMDLALPKFAYGGEQSIYKRSVFRFPVNTSEASTILTHASILPPDRSSVSSSPHFPPNRLQLLAQQALQQLICTYFHLKVLSYC